MLGQRLGSEGNQEAVLRRLAIVLRDVPPPTYLKIMNYLDDELSDKIKDAISRLGEVKIEERSKALEVFNSSFQLQKDQADSIDSLQLTSLGYHSSESLGSENIRIESNANSLQFKKQAEKFKASAAPHSVSELAFLNEVEPDLLMSLLEQEQPQTISLVMASIDPAVAAGILGRLTPTVQYETMVRISRLMKIPHAAFEEVANHFKSRLKSLAVSKADSSGANALKAIMEVMPKQSVEDVMISEQQAVADFTKEKEMTLARLTQKHLSDPNAVVFSHNHLSGSEDFEATDDSGTNDENRDGEQVIAGAHEYLIHLSPKTLCLALSHVSTRDALLVLCGLPESVSNRVIALLSRSQAKSVRRKMAVTQSMSLKAMDEAKCKVAGIAREITDNLPLASKTA